MLKRLKAKHPDCEISTRADGSTVFVNPANQKILWIESDAALYFATQHRHCMDWAEAEALADAFLSDELASVEFSREGRPCFGGDIETTKKITVEALTHRFYYSPETLAGLTVEVQSWSGKWDGVYRITEKDGNFQLVQA